MRHLNKLTILVMLLLSMTSAANASPQDVLGKLLGDIDSISAAFTQSTIDGNGEEVNRSEGQLSVGSGGRFRIETVSPFPQQLVSNGQDFYAYDPDLEQVVIRALVNDVNQVPILLLGNAQPEFLTQYDITQIDEERHSQFLLNAKASDSVFESLRLTFVQAQPVKIVLTDSLGQTTAIELSQVKLNTLINNEQFTFTPPDGVDVIDDR